MCKRQVGSWRREKCYSRAKSDILFKILRKSGYTEVVEFNRYPKGLVEMDRFINNDYLVRKFHNESDAFTRSFRFLPDAQITSRSSISSRNSCTSSFWQQPSIPSFDGQIAGLSSELSEEGIHNLNGGGTN
jgi:hypothetical protein